MNAMTNQKETPLYWVARAVSLEKEAVEKTMQVLHEEGANLMVVNAVGQTPLFVAASCGHFAAVRTLVKLGALVGAGCQSVRGCNRLPAGWQACNSWVLRRLRKHLSTQLVREATLTFVSTCFVTKLG